MCRGHLESQKNAGSQMPQLRAMVQGSREKEQKQQHIHETENIFLKVVLLQVFEITTRSRLVGPPGVLHGIPYVLENSSCSLEVDGAERKVS
ncbi:hypothetical protein TNCV_5050421 [Trichonephila clavipes]|nr:hypothetical protein TNCV_5050421 [Trichonephila clavipes]